MKRLAHVLSVILAIIGAVLGVLYLAALAFNHFAAMKGIAL